MNNYWLGVAAIAASMFLRMLGVFIALPIMGYALDDLYQTTALLTGIAIGIHGLSQSVLQILFGYWSDRWQRKPVIIIGLILFSIGSVIAAYSSSIYGVIVGRFLQGAGAIGSASLAFITDKVDSERQPIAVGIFGAGIGAAFMLSLYLGPIIYGSYGLKGVFLLGALLSVIAIAMIANIEEKHSGYANLIYDGASLKKSLSNVFFSDMKLPISFAIVLIIHAKLATYFLVVPRMVGPISYKDYLIAMAASLALLGISSLRKNCYRFVIVFLALMFVGQIAMYCGLAIPGFIVFLIAFIVLEALLPTVVSSYSHSKEKGIALGVYTTFQFLGVFLGGTYSGFVLNYFSIDLLLILASFMTLVILVMISVCTVLHNRRPVSQV